MDRINCSRTTCLLVIGICWSTAIGPVLAEEQTVSAITYQEAVLTGQLECQDIKEISGVAASQIQDNVFWTHNDSGDRPRLFAFDRTGRHLGQWSLDIKKATDWEDMAAAQVDGKPMLIIADTGDNKRKRDQYRLHFVLESIPAKGSKLELVRTVRFRYETGSHDCEAVAFDSVKNKVLLITKTWEPGCELNVIDWPPIVDKKGRATARKIATLSLAGVTGLDISPSGRFAIATTYGNAYLFERAPSETWAKVFEGGGTSIVLPPRKQGEAICFAHDGRSLVLTSEKLPTPVYCLDADDE